MADPTSDERRREDEIIETNVDKTGAELERSSKFKSFHSFNNDNQLVKSMVMNPEVNEKLT